MLKGNLSHYFEAYFSFVNLVPGGEKNHYSNDKQKTGGLSTEKKAEFERQSWWSVETVLSSLCVCSMWLVCISNWCARWSFSWKHIETHQQLLNNMTVVEFIVWWPYYSSEASLIVCFPTQMCWYGSKVTGILCLHCEGSGTIEVKLHVSIFFFCHSRLNTEQLAFGQQSAPIWSISLRKWRSLLTEHLNLIYCLLTLNDVSCLKYVNQRRIKRFRSSTISKF